MEEIMEIRDRHYYPMAGGHIGPWEMLNGAAAICLIAFMVQLALDVINGIQALLAWAGF